VKDKNGDRDASVGRLLAGTLKAHAEAAPEAACLDAETLAAWADGALDVRERARAEAHAADCGRCQALLAAMVRTAPPPSPAEAPFRARLLWWLAPIVPVAAAVAIWFAVPNREPLEQSDNGAAAAVEQAAPAARPAPSADAKVKAETDAQPQDQVANKRDTVPMPAPPPADLRERRAAAPVEHDRAVPAAPARANAPVDALAGAPASPPPSAAEASPRREAFAAPSRLSTFASVPEIVIVSSNPSTRFRLVRGGGVQRSADAGATWQTEVTGATDTLTAGSSPSPSICWLIGPSGTVLLSTDGRSWRRRPFPESVDLRSITASDADNATVTTADGRAFVTTDGGGTWAQSPH
jgi:hypothetical protein